MRTDQNCAKWNFSFFCTKMEKTPSIFSTPKNFFLDIQWKLLSGVIGRADHSAAIGFVLVPFLFEIGPPQGAQCLFTLKVAKIAQILTKLAKNCHNGILRMRTDQNFAKRNYSFFAPKWKKTPRL